jgi:hypothetical protein
VICPLCETKRCGHQAAAFLVLGLAFAFLFLQNRSRRRRGGKVGISRFPRDFQGSVGAGENLLLVFAGFHAPAFSTRSLGFPPLSGSPALL